MRRKEAASSLGVTTNTIRQVAKRLDIHIPKRPLAADLIKPYEARILAGEISQHEIARELSLSQCRISKLYRELGYPAFPKGGRGLNAVLPFKERAAQAEQVIAHLKEHGGYVVPTIRELDLAIDKTFFYKYAKDNGLIANGTNLAIKNMDIG